MSKIHVSVPHELGQAEAERRIKGFLDIAQKKLSEGPVSAPGIPPVSGSLVQEWKGSTGTINFSAQGMALEGTLEVAADKIDLVTKIPLMAMMFKGKLEAALTDGLKAIVKK